MAEKKQSSNYDSQTEKISNPARITALLKNILEARTLLRVTIPGSSVGYNSAILEVNREDNYIILDELNPLDGHDRLLEKKKLAVFTHLNGVDVSFGSPLRQVLLEDDIASYKVQLPKILNYRQLRAYYRVHVGITEIPVHILLNDGSSLKGEIHDISSGGLCIRFTTNIPDYLKRGNIIECCTVDLSDGNKLESRLEIRFRGDKDEKGRTLVGGQFVDIDRHQQRMVERYVAGLDREIRRKS